MQRDTRERQEKDVEVTKQKENMQKIIEKRKDIKRLEDAIKGFTAEKNRTVVAASAAKRAGNGKEAVIYMRKVARLKARIAQYDNSLMQQNQQLEGIEDLSFFSQDHAKNEKFVEDIGNFSTTVEDVEETLDDVRAKLQDVENINLTFKADAAQDSTLLGDDAMMEELAKLEMEQEAEAHNIDHLGPSVPADNPTMPEMMSDPLQLENDEIAMLEKDIMLLQTS